MTSIRTERVLILELFANGHHPRYVRWILESGIGKSAELILASGREMFEHPEIQACEARFTPYTLEVEPALEALFTGNGIASLTRRSRMIGNLYRKACFDLARNEPIDFAIVPYFDNCILGLTVPQEAFGGIPWATVTMRTMFHYSHMGLIAPKQRLTAVRRFLFHRALNQKSLTAVLTIDPVLAEFAQKQGEPLFRKVEYLPDPAVHHKCLISKVEARGQLGIPLDARLVLLYGELSARKGMFSLMEALADSECSRQVHLLMAGRYSEPSQILQSEAFRGLTTEGRIHTIVGYLGDEQERQILAAADCSWVGYTDFYGMSGIMALSGMHGIPVLAASGGLIGHFTRTYEIGTIIDPSNRRSVVAALNRLVFDPEFFLRAGKNGTRTFQNHTVQELQRIVTAKALQAWTQ